MLGMTEILIIVFVVIILLFGAKKLPELARSMGRAKGEFERGKLEIEREIREAKAKDEKKEEKAKDAKKEEEDVVKAAKELGIETEGKTEEELKAEIKKKME